jgi:hypothetical protein
MDGRLPLGSTSWQSARRSSVTALCLRRFVADDVLYWCLHFGAEHTHTMTGVQHA